MSINHKYPIEVLEKKPDGFSPELEVTACYVECEGSFLLLKRGPLQPCPGTWGLPAGKLEEKESILEAMIREISEEIGWVLEHNVLTYLDPLFVISPEKEFVFHMFHFSLKEKREVVLSHEHVDYTWATPEEARRMQLIPGGEKSLELFCKRLRKLI